MHIFNLWSKRRRTEEPPLYFLHIPKTAGTTFISILHKEYEPSQVCPAYLWHEFLALSPKRLKRFGLFRGHFSYCFKSHLPLEPTIITLLREPIARSLSLYKHLLRKPEHYFHQKTKDQNDLFAFLMDPQMSLLIRNFQTRSLAVDFDPVSIYKTLTKEQLQKYDLERILECMVPSISDDEQLSIAKKRLSEFFAVGIVEEFERSLALFAQRLNWKKPVSYEDLNKAPDSLKVDLPPKTLELLKQNLQLDFELYEFGKHLFQEQCCKAGLK